MSDNIPKHDDVATTLDLLKKRLYRLDTFKPECVEAYMDELERLSNEIEALLVDNDLDEDDLDDEDE